MRELLVTALAAAPIIEVRGAIPVGMASGFAPLKNIIICTIGSIIPVIPILFFLNFLTERLRKFERWDRFFDRLFTHTRAKSKLIENYEFAGLIVCCNKEGIELEVL